MLKPFRLIFFVLIMAWFGSIFVTTDPQVRMDRTCVPVEYMDRAGTAGMQLVDASWGAATHQFFQNMHYGCRFVVWRVFYEEDWNRATQQQQRQSTVPADSSAEKSPADVSVKRSIGKH